MRVARALLMAGGLALGLVGAWYLLDAGLDNLFHAVVWLGAGVFLHDAVLAPAVLVVGVLGARLLPTWARGPVTVGAVVLGTVTLAAIPVLGRFGERPDNPTLLDRNYTQGWLLLAGVVVLAVAAGAAWSLLRSRRLAAQWAARPRRPRLRI